MKFNKKEKKPEIVKPVKVQEKSVKETSDLKEAIQLQKEGWVVTDIKSSPKTWILKK